ncbi:hypothetical protein Thiosp_00558 [Thiorhodovibrio litoralis]|nr:hypothetical protein Thiosp_00558 [Thiorhodovibrio litoralis]
MPGWHSFYSVRLRVDTSVNGCTEVNLSAVDLAELGLNNASGALTPGQPAFAPADLLRLRQDARKVNRA